MLGQHIQRGFVEHDGVEITGLDGAQQRHALHQLVPGGRKQAALGHAAHLVPRAPYPLQERRDAAWRAQLTDEINGADVDPQLE